jgi:hypothetical protein
MAAQNIDRTLAMETEMTILTATTGTLVEHLFVAIDQALENHSV